MNPSSIKMESNHTGMWVNFFTMSGIPSDVAATYALTFTENRIQTDMLLDLNKEYLRDMGITRMGDVIAILRHAKQVHESTARDRVLSSAVSIKVPVAAVTGRSTASPSSPASRILEHYTRNPQVQDSPTAAIKRKSNDNMGRRVSGRQLRKLWELLNSNRDIATAYNRSLQAKEYSQKKWKEISEILNSQGDGAYKDWRGWSKYWVDLKAKIKMKVAAGHSHVQTKGGPSIEKTLTELEEKFLKILGHDFGQVEPLTERSDIDAATKGVDVKNYPASEYIPQQVQSVPDPRFLIPIKNLPVEATQNPLPQNPLVQDSSRSPSSNPTRCPGPATLPAAHSPPPRRRRWREKREPTMSQEAARRALVRSSQMRAEAALRTAEAMEKMVQIMADLQNTAMRIERSHDRLDADTNLKKARLIRFTSPPKSSIKEVTSNKAVFTSNKTVFSRLGNTETVNSVPTKEPVKPIYARLGSKPDKVGTIPDKPGFIVAKPSFIVDKSVFKPDTSGYKAEGLAIPIDKNALKYEGILKSTAVMKKVVTVTTSKNNVRKIAMGCTMRADETPMSVKEKLSIPKAKSVKFSSQVQYKEIEPTLKPKPAQKFTPVFNKPERRLSMPEKDGVKARLGEKNANNLTITKNVFNRLGV